MIFRRAKQPAFVAEMDEQDARKRADRSRRDPGEPAETEQPAAELPTGDGPYDANEIGVDGPPPQGAIDLGGLIVRTPPGVDLRVQVDEKSKGVVAAVLVQQEAGLELRAFAAPRSTGLWDDVRREVAAEATRRGGVATERNGPFGTEIVVAVPAATDASSTQTSRIVGVDGPRWFLRATFVGLAATEAEAALPLEVALADVIVVRGKDPMAPRDMIALKLPPEATSDPDSGQSSAMTRGGA